MPAVSRTSAFRELIPSTSSTSSSPSSASASGSATTSRRESSASIGAKSLFERKRVRRSEKEIEEDKLRKEFGEEAYRIHHHLASLSIHLTRIRPAYLAQGSGLPSHRRRRHTPNSRSDSRTLSANATTELLNSREESEEEESLRQLEGLPWLTDSEKDEIELRGKVVIRGCGGRVGLLGKVEQSRQSLHASQHITPSSLLSTFLPSLASSRLTPSNSASSSTLSGGGSTTETQLSAHHASIILFLNTGLLKISEQLTSMGEERWRNRVERERSLGGMVGEGVSRADGGPNGNGSSMWDVIRGEQGRDKDGQASETWRGVKLTVPTDPGLAARAAAKSGSGQFTFSQTAWDDDPEEELPPPLTEAQIQEYSSESSQLLESMSSTLDSTLRAEQSLLEIASLQTTLITHLQTQTETINLLYDDAIGTVGEVERANVQLRQAKERGGSARLFLLVFLIGSSFALLFLDYYS